MSLYLAQVAYTPEAWQALVRNPQDRFEAVRPAVEKLGGKLVSAWFAFGDCDIVCRHRYAQQRRRRGHLHRLRRRRRL